MTARGAIAGALEPRLRLAHAAWRAGRAATAERLACDFETGAGATPESRWLRGVARLDQDDAPGSLTLLEGVLAGSVDFHEARVDLARALRRAGRAAEARPEVRRVLQEAPNHHRAWLAYGDVLVDLGQLADARIAFERAQRTDPESGTIQRATAALLADDRRTSEGLFRGILQTDPGHVAALCGLAALSLAADRPIDGERLLRHALKQSAHVPLAWRGLGPALLALGRLLEAEAACRHLLELEPDNPQSLILLAGVSTRLMRQEVALAAYQRAAVLKPGEVRLWMSLGHVYKTLGRRQESEAAYKTALQVRPGHGEAYWSLADLKNYDFSATEMADMEALLERSAGHDSADPDQAQLLFAMGKAFEQRGRHDQAFVHYARGNRLRRRQSPFDIEHFEARTGRICDTFNTDFFAARGGIGERSRTPIFIVGLPRSGSTLVEQILASHSQVEGTMELPNILNLVREFDDATAARDGYPRSVRELPEPAFAALGRRYLEETAPLRSNRERFTDKLPNNFSHIGLIQAILPAATIIDVRRHPLDCCFSAYKQYFAEGQSFTYDLTDLGRYYRCYLRLMDHWDRVLPGRVLRVQYEVLVREPERTIRNLLQHCGLEFEERCLHFHQTRRAVRTPSAEQVRQPIYSSGVGHWRNFERELAPLRSALGDSLERFENLD